MIKEEQITIRNRIFFYTYSDAGYYIVDKDNNKYASAYDIVHKDYKESDELIKKTEETNNDAG